MTFDFERPSPPTDDKRWKKVAATMRRAGGGPEALIESLHTLQDGFGYLEEDALKYVAASLRVPFSKVYGVATFYHHFRLRPAGRHRCVVCTGTACHLQGAGAILARLADRFALVPGEMGLDGKVSLLTARCLGSCGVAPVAVFDDEVLGRLEEETVIHRIEGWLQDDA